MTALIPCFRLSDDIVGDILGLDTYCLEVDIHVQKGVRSLSLPCKVWSRK